MHPVFVFLAKVRLPISYPVIVRDLTPSRSSKKVDMVWHATIYRARQPVSKHRMREQLAKLVVEHWSEPPRASALYRE